MASAAGLTTGGEPVSAVVVDREVEQFTRSTHQLFIGGRWVDAVSGETFDTPNPATGDKLATVAAGGPQDIDRAVRAARVAFEDGPWSRMTPSERGRLVWKIGDLILEHLEELAQLESLDNGKPLTIARAADVPLAADLFHYMAGWATKIEGNTIDISVPYAPGGASSTRTRCANRSVWSARSSPGTFRFSWRRGSSARPWRLATVWF